MCWCYKKVQNSSRYSKLEVAKVRRMLGLKRLVGHELQLAEMFGILWDVSVLFVLPKAHLVIFQSHCKKMH